ncbi:MAG: PD-(D/E)XK nuclease family protein, partial [Acidobacteria bacterium]|nr:PD-(D/E)XK nuclease family protein [Acidobacteriota bacterium]
ATRARKRLHLLGHTGLTWKGGSAALRAPASGSLLAHLWPVVEAEFRALPLPSNVPAEAQPEPRRSLAIRRLPAAWFLPPVPEPVRWAAAADAGGEREVSFVWAGEVLRHVGTVVHRMLRRIAEEGVARWSSETVHAQQAICAAALASLGVPAGEIEAASAKVAEALERALCDPRGRWILDDRHAQARCEFAISGIVNGRVVDSRVDRTFVDADGTRWIIDYKTGTHEGGGLEGFLDNERARYAAQLEAYAALFAGMESRPIRLGLFFPLLGAWREWSPELQLRTAGL